MTHKIIHIENYLLVLGDLYKSYQFPYTVVERLATGDFHLWQVDNENDWDERNQYEIIAHLPLDAPILEGVDLLPPLEDDVEKLADALGFYDSTEDNKGNRTAKAFIAGYNKAKEKYKYTEEDLKNEIIRAFKYGQSNAEMMEAGLERNEVDDYTNNRIQSLQQPKMPIGFKCEIDDIGYPVMFPESNKKYYSNSDSMYVNYQEKTTTNSQGLTQWVGTYKYE